MASVQLVGVVGNSLVSAGDKFRVTWTWALSWAVPANFWDIRSADLSVQASLPSMGLGFVPVSSPQAKAGDAVIVYDVRLSQAWGTGHTVADVVAALDQLPLLQNVQLDVSRVESVPLTTPSSALGSGQQSAVSQGNAATGGTLLGGVTGFLKGLSITAVVGALAIAAFFVYRKTR